MDGWKMRGPMKTLTYAVLAALLLAVPGLAVAEQRQPEMIAVAAASNDLSSPVSGRPGQSPLFLLFDMQGGFIEAVENPYKDVKGNAGIPTVDFLKSKGVKVIVAASLGSRIEQVMQSKGMQPIEFAGQVRDAVKRAVELMKKK